MADQNENIMDTLTAVEAVSSNGIDIDDEFVASDSSSVPPVFEVSDSITGSDVLASEAIVYLDDSLEGLDVTEVPFLDVNMEIVPIEQVNTNIDLSAIDIFWTLSNVDFGIPGLKRITSIAIGANTNEFFQVLIEVSYGSDIEKREVRTVTGKDHQVAFPVVEGHSFDISLFVPSGSGLVFDEFTYIVIEYQLNDKRFRRSSYAVSN